MLVTDAHATNGMGRDDPGGADAGARDERPRRFRFRIGTLLFVIAILALLLVVLIQQVQLERMRQRAAVLQNQVDQAARDKDAMTTIIRELRDRVERLLR